MCQHKKKILFILPSSVGGAERMTVTISKLFSDEEAEVKYVIISRTLGSIVNFIPKNREIIHIKTVTVWDVVTLRLYRLFKQESPTHVFCSLIYLSSRVIIAAKMCGGIKIVVRSDNSVSTIINKKRVFWPFLITYPLADVIIAQQEEMQKELYDLLRKRNPHIKVVCLHNLLDTDTIDRLKNATSPYSNNEEIRFVWTARFAKTKGQDVLVRAFAKVHKNILRAHLYLVGKYSKNDEFFKDVHRYVIENRLTENIHFIGFDRNPYKWVANADCFVMPSRVEGLPNALIDAMYLKKPVAATKCIPMVGRIVKDGYNGILAVSEDIDSLAYAMIQALKLKDFKMTYQSSTKEDFRNVF